VESWQRISTRCCGRHRIMTEMSSRISGKIGCMSILGCSHREVEGYNALLAPRIFSARRKSKIHMIRLLRNYVQGRIPVPHRPAEADAHDDAPEKVQFSRRTVLAVNCLPPGSPCRVHACRPAELTINCKPPNLLPPWFLVRVLPGVDKCGRSIRRLNGGRIESCRRRRIPIPGLR